jgi:DNA-directed RNA polymerase specialized sigma24 family protein
MKKTGRELPEDLSLITEEWKEIYEKLLLYTRRRYYWLAQMMRGKYDLEELATQAILDTLSGKRTWPPKDAQGQPRKVNLISFLCRVVDSLASHQYEKELRQHEPQLSNHFPDDDLHTSTPSGSYRLQSLMSTLNEQVRLLVSGEGIHWDSNKIHEAIIYNEICEQMIDLVHEDEKLTLLVKTWIADPTAPPREIAQRLGWTIEEMRYHQRQLRIRLRNWRNEFSGR